MKRRLFKTIALAICFCSTVGALVGKTLVNEQKWFTVDDTSKSNPLDTAPCLNNTSAECARLFERVNSSSPWTQVMEDGSPVIAYGDRNN